MQLEMSLPSFNNIWLWWLVLLSTPQTALGSQPRGASQSAVPRGQGAPHCAYARCPGGGGEEEDPDTKPDQSC